MKPVRLYKTTCTKAYQISEQGVGFSLSPFGKNTDVIEGFDDGGKLYVLPDGVDVCEMSVPGDIGFFGGDTHLELISKFGRPALVNADGTEIILKDAE